MGITEYSESDTTGGVTKIYTILEDRSYSLHTEKQTVDLVTTQEGEQLLFLDKILQSSTQDESYYHLALVHPLLELLKSRNSVLILGGAEGATAREVLRWEDVKQVTMVDYDKELVDFMKLRGQQWSKGAFDDSRLTLLYEDAWTFIEKENEYDAIIVDLTDPDLLTENWESLLSSVFKRIQTKKGGFVLNAGPYIPWNTDTLIKIQQILDTLFQTYYGYKYNFYTVVIPSFGGEWAFIEVNPSSRHMIDVEHLCIFPRQMRRQVRLLDIHMCSEVDTQSSSGPLKRMYF